MNWHYATGLQMASAGVGIGPIVLARMISARRIGKGSRSVPVVWFSADQTWEPTAGAGGMRTASGSMLTGTTVQEQAVITQGAYRFGLPAEMTSAYPACCAEVGVSIEDRRRLNADARRVGALPRNWSVVTRDVPLDDPALIFEYWLSDRWNVSPIGDMHDVVVMCSETFYPLTAEAMAT